MTDAGSRTRRSPRDRRRSRYTNIVREAAEILNETRVATQEIWDATIASIQVKLKVSPHSAEKLLSDTLASSERIREDLRSAVNGVYAKTYRKNPRMSRAERGHSDLVKKAQALGGNDFLVRIYHGIYAVEATNAQDKGLVIAPDSIGDPEAVRIEAAGLINELRIGPSENPQAPLSPDDPNEITTDEYDVLLFAATLVTTAARFGLSSSQTSRPVIVLRNAIAQFAAGAMKSQVQWNPGTRKEKEWLFDNFMEALNGSYGPRMLDGSSTVWDQFTRPAAPGSRDHYGNIEDDALARLEMMLSPRAASPTETPTTPRHGVAPTAVLPRVDAGVTNPPPFGPSGPGSLT